jgi:hypothetical protein
MTISRTEQFTLTCPSCAARFAADLWTLIDAGERPDLRDMLLEGQLNRAGCLRCGEEFLPSTAVLLHDPAARLVYFAVPSDTAEHVWREQAQSLLYELVAHLPEEQRLPYLGDVQLEQELDGVRRALQRRNRRRQHARTGTGAAAAPVPLATQQPAMSQSGSLLEAIQRLLSADSPADFERQARDNPLLLGEAADGMLIRLIAEADIQGQRDVVDALRLARAELARIRSGSAQDAESVEPIPGITSDEPGLSSVAYQAFLHADSDEELLDAARSHPQLLEPHANERIAMRAEAALDEGNERLAAAIASRLDALVALQSELVAPDALAAAALALLEAVGEDALADTLGAYPALLTEAALATLGKLALDARARGDQAGAARIDERRAVLQTIRHGLDGD